MSLVDLADAQARSGDSITQDMVDEEESWLAHEIGPLTGERNETFFLPSRLNGPVDGLFLSRTTDEVDSLTSAGTTISDWRLLDGYLVEMESDSDETWDTPMVATYTPNDETIIKGVIYDLLAFRSSQQPGLQSVKIGEYSETYAIGRNSAPYRALIRRCFTRSGLGAYSLPFRYRRWARDRTLIEQTGS